MESQSPTDAGGTQRIEEKDPIPQNAEGQDTKQELARIILDKAQVIHEELVKEQSVLRKQIQGIPGGPHLIWMVEKIQAGSSNIEVAVQVQKYEDDCVNQILTIVQQHLGTISLLEKPTDLKVRRGLGILEELIMEKNPDFFKIQEAKKQASRPLGIAVSEIMKRLPVQVRPMRSGNQAPLSSFDPAQGLISSAGKRSRSKLDVQMMSDEEELKDSELKMIQSQINSADQKINRSEDIKPFAAIHKDYQMKSERINDFDLPSIIPKNSNDMNESLISDTKMSIPEAKIPSLDRINQKPEFEIDDSISSIAINEAQNAIIDETQIIHPYTYQKKIVEKILFQWGLQVDNPESMVNPFKSFGSIIFIETGAGKSYISLMLIKSLFGEPHDQLAELTPEQLKDKRMNNSGNLLYDENEASKRKKVVFIVPTNNLVDQQSSVIERYTEKVRVGKFQGGKNNKKVYKYENWIQQFRDNDVFVFIARKFYDLLMHGYIKMDQIDLLILDEAHHTNQEHLYNLIMTDFYYSGYYPGLTKRPKILALTASPIKQKIEASKIYKHEIEEFLQSLADNLYSKFVSVSAQDLDEMRNECKIQVMTYESLFEFNSHTVRLIEQNLILKLLKLLEPENLPPQFYKVSGGGAGFDVRNEEHARASLSLLRVLNSTMVEEFKRNQDTQILKFINTRKKFIDIEVDESKKIDLASFKNPEDRTLILVIIMLLKNINNLIVELGMFGLQMFLIDLRRDLLEKQSEKFKHKGKDMIQIFNYFIDEMLVKEIGGNHNMYQQMLAEKRAQQVLGGFDKPTEAIRNTEVSGKVSELVRIMETEYEGNPKLKAIVFVKDRSVATYLKKILDFMFQSKQRNVRTELDEPNFESSSSIIADFHKLNQSNPEKLDQNVYEGKFRCNFAIGFQGKSLTNKAYRSTKSIEDEINQLEEFLPQFSQVKMSHQNLMKNIDDFKNDKINILIATSVIEEGLDVSTCNLVVSINEVLNVKSFIQTKGRARQRNSKFIFLCAEEEKSQVCETIEGFKKLISNIQEIAYSDGDKVILPNPNIIIQKQRDPWQYLVTQPPFQAKCTMREAPAMLDLLCNEIIDELTNSRLRESDLLPQNLQMTEEEKLEMQKIDQIRLKRKIDVQTVENVDPFKNRTFTTRLIMPEYLKYFFANKGGVAYSDKKFQKKKDSENYVSLLTVKRLYECRLYGNDLYPNLNKYLNMKIISDEQAQLEAPSQPKNQQVSLSQKQQNQMMAQKFIEELKQQYDFSQKPQGPQQPTKNQISQQLMQAKQELQSQKEQYTRDSKKSSLPVPVHSVFLNKELRIKSAQIQSIADQSSLVEEVKESFIQQEPEHVMTQSFYVLVFQGVNSLFHSEVQTQSSFSLRRKFVDSSSQTNLDGQYPYRSMNEHIGILWDKNLSSEEYKLFIELQQENRQKQKNAYYLEKLFDLNLISAEQKISMLQMQDILELRIETVKLELNQAELIQKLKFFHFWFFQYVNNASFRFYKKLFKRQYTFSGIFGTVLNFLLKIAKGQRKYIKHDFLDSLFGIKDGLDVKFETKIDENNQALKEIGTFLVPVVSTPLPQSSAQDIDNLMVIDEGKPAVQPPKYSINWVMIEELIDFVKADLLTQFISENSEKSKIMNKYDLAIPQPKIYDNQKENHQDILRDKVQNLWQCESNQSVFILMSVIGSEDRLYQDSQPQIGTVLRKHQPSINSLNQSVSENGYCAGHSAIMTTEIDHEVNWCYKNISVHNYKSQNYLGVQHNKLGAKGMAFMRQENQSLAEHFFAKTGVYLSRKDNPYLFKCSKERCLLDFSVQKSTIINTQTEENKNNSQLIEKPKPAASASQQASTLFDVPQQLMRILPLKYDQYQMLQMSNFCYASLLEIIKVENFINTFLSDLNIHLENPSNQINLQQWHLTPRLHETSNQMPLSTYMKQDFMLMMEAMTAPTANKPIDYERLEFYGDSVISFLVILELFLTTATLDRNYKEGELDFERIKKVSNMNLALTNESHRIYQYIITDSTKVIADELSPPGFKSLDYQLKVKSKSVNEIKSKLLYLKKCEVLISERIAKKVYRKQIVDADYVELVRMFLLQNDLAQIIQNFYPDAWQTYKSEKERIMSKWHARRNTKSLADISAVAQTKPKLDEKLDIFTFPFIPEGASLRNVDISWRIAERWFYENHLSIDHLRLCVVQANIDKSESKCRKEKGKRQQAVNQQMAQLANSGGGKSKKKRGNESNISMNREVTEKMRHFQSKQLADTVESITGAVAQAAGLFSAQDLLHKLGVLKCSTERYEEELNKFLSSNYFVGPGYVAIMSKYGDLFNELQEIIGYKFNNPCLLVQAMTHKSFKEHFNTMKDHQSHVDMRLDDYERLEFLGDSILNFLVAQHYFNTSKETPQDYQPKQLHKLKTSVVNNVFLSLVLVQRGVHKYVLYNQISDQFKKQYEQYVDVVQGLLAQALIKKDEGAGGEESMLIDDGEEILSRAEELSEQEFGYINLEPLYEHSLKIFGDVFESLIGAVFLDSRSISKTEAILYSLLKPFLKTHANVETLDDHSRTKLLELWNSKPYSRQFKIKHEVDQKNDGSAVFRGLVNKIEVRRVTFQKDMKNKVRRFYNDFYEFIEAFIKQYEEKYGGDAHHIDKELREYRKIYEGIKKAQQPATTQKKIQNQH